MYHLLNIFLKPKKTGKIGIFKNARFPKSCWIKFDYFKAILQTVLLIEERLITLHISSFSNFAVTVGMGNKIASFRFI